MDSSELSLHHLRGREGGEGKGGRGGQGREGRAREGGEGKGGRGGEGREVRGREGGRGREEGWFTTEVTRKHIQGSVTNFPSEETRVFMDSTLVVPVMLQLTCHCQWHSC